MNSLALRVTGLAAALAIASFAPADAQPAAPPAMKVVRSAASLLKVSNCDPERTVSGPAYSGFAPAFYPLQPYYWTDPYGFQYRQFAPMTHTGSLSIDYVNITKQVMKTIDFGLVARGKLVAEVRDVGTFSPGAEIKHTFGLSNNVFPLRTALSQCLPLRIVFKDGTTWTNPHLPKVRKEIYK